MKKLFLTLFGLALSINGFAYDFQLDGIYYTIISESDCTVEVTRNNDKYYSGNMVIPKQVTKYGQTYTVTRIGENAFYDCKNLYSVTIPETVDSINSGAFIWCSAITEINVDGNSPYFQSKDGVLFNKAMTKLLHFPNAKSGDYQIPDGVETIGSHSFNTNMQLHSVSMPSTVKRIEKQAFEICETLYDVQLSSSLEFIGSNAFSSCPFSTITLPESLKYLDSEAFNGCDRLTSLFIPKNVEFIGDNTAIGYCTSMERIDVAPENPHYTSIDGILYDKALTKVLKCPSQIQDLEWITLPSTITHICKSAFHTNKSLARIVIPAGVTEIGGGAFYYCSNLSRVTCYATTPPSTPLEQYSTSDPWDYSGRSTATLYVPKGCADVYRNFYNRTYYYGNVYPYAKFKEIVEMDEEAGISSGIYDDCKIEVSRYNASGIKLDSAAKGLNIIRMSDGTTKKIIK